MLQPLSHSSNIVPSQMHSIDTKTENELIIPVRDILHLINSAETFSEKIVYFIEMYTILTEKVHLVVKYEKLLNVTISKVSEYYTDLVDALLKGKCSEDLFKMCVNTLNKYLFAINTEQYKD